MWPKKFCANLALSVARSDTKRATTFVTIVGGDSDGAQAVTELESEMTVCATKVSDQTPGQYMCVAQPDGELYVAAQDMEFASHVNVELDADLVAQSAAILLDFNFNLVC